MAVAEESELIEVGEGARQQERLGGEEDDRR